MSFHFEPVWGSDFEDVDLEVPTTDVPNVQAADVPNVQTDVSNIEVHAACQLKYKT